MMKIATGVTTAVLVAAFTLASTMPANAATSNFGPRTCTGGAHNGISTVTKGATSHTVWSSASNNQGTSWAGDSTWRSRAFVSTKTTSSANYATYTSLYVGSSTCIIDI